MVTYYHRFLPHAAQVLEPLYSAKKQGTKNTRLTWSQDMRQAFENIKKLIAEATMLVHPHDSAPLSLFSDASDSAVGAVLQQWHNGMWQPLAFFSKLLRKPELKYSTFDKELLALYLATRHF